MFWESFGTKHFVPGHPRNSLSISRRARCTTSEVSGSVLRSTTLRSTALPSSAARFVLPRFSFSDVRARYDVAPLAQSPAPPGFSFARGARDSPWDRGWSPKERVGYDDDVDDDAATYRELCDRSLPGETTSAIFRSFLRFAKSSVLFYSFLISH